MNAHHLTTAVALLLAAAAPAGADLVSFQAPGGYNTFPTGVSGSTVVGYYLDPGRGYRGFLYDGAAFTSLDVPRAEWTTTATGVSGSTVVGYYLDPGRGYRGFLYDGSGYTTLHVPGSSGTHAHGISGATVVGYYLDPAVGI